VSWHIYVSSKFDIQNHLLSIGAGMKKLRIKLAVAAVLGALSITPAMATPVLDTSGNVLMGIKGVQVGTLFYDVAFGDTDSTQAQSYAFNTVEQAKAATAALFSLFDVGNVAQWYGDKDLTTNEYSINGIAVWSLYADIYTEYAKGYFVSNTQRIGVEAEGAGQPMTEQTEAQMMRYGLLVVGNNRATIATWTQSPTEAQQTQQPISNAVPEPTAISLLGIGALGYAASRRQSKYTTQPDTMPTTA
jgi:hypothetical protein